MVSRTSWGNYQLTKEVSDVTNVPHVLMKLVMPQVIDLMVL